MSECNQYYQYNPYMMQAQYTGTPAWAFSLDDYTDDSDSDCDVQTATPPIAKPATMPTAMQKEGDTMTLTAASAITMDDSSDSDIEAQAVDKPATSSPRSQDASTCDPDSDAFSLGSDSEDAEKQSVAVVSVSLEPPPFSVASLLKLRHSVSWLEGIEDRQLKAAEHECAFKMQPDCAPETTMQKEVKRSRKVAKASKKKGCGTAASGGIAQDKPKPSQQLQASEDSWMAQQMAHRHSVESKNEVGSVSDEDVMRAVRSVLNKLTIEKFHPLYEKLVSCGIRTRAHVSSLMVEVFEKAATQHHFTDMYADLCVLLRSHFGEHHIADDPDMNFESLLLQSRASFSQRYLTLPSDLETLEEEDRLIVESKHKVRKLGNMKFFGALLVRLMLDSALLFETCEELLAEATPEALELLAVLLTTVGPKFDTKKWPSYLRLSEIFDQVHKLASSPNLNRRVCFLLRDLLELRSMRWVDQKPKLADGPSTLKEVADQQAAEDDLAPLHCAPCARQTRVQLARTQAQEVRAKVQEVDTCYFGQRCNWPGCRYKHPDGRLMDVEKVVAVSKEMPDPAKSESASKSSSVAQKVGKVKRRYRKNVCRKEIAEAMAELRKSQNIHGALESLALIAVPASKQPEEFCDMLKIMMKEASEVNRKVFFEMVARLFIEDVWTQSALTSGLEMLLESYDLKHEEPVLSKILWEELHPAIAPLVSKALSQ